MERAKRDREGPCHLLALPEGTVTAALGTRLSHTAGPHLPAELGGNGVRSALRPAPQESFGAPVPQGSWRLLCARVPRTPPRAEEQTPLHPLARCHPQGDRDPQCGRAPSHSLTAALTRGRGQAERRAPHHGNARRAGGSAGGGSCASRRQAVGGGRVSLHIWSRSRRSGGGPARPSPSSEGPWLCGAGAGAGPAQGPPRGPRGRALPPLAPCCSAVALQSGRQGTGLPQGRGADGRGKLGSPATRTAARLPLLLGSKHRLPGRQGRPGLCPPRRRAWGWLVTRHEWPESPLVDGISRYWCLTLSQHT